VRVYAIIEAATGTVLQERTVPNVELASNFACTLLCGPENFVKPIFVSAGHKIHLRTAVRLILQCAQGYRIPKPTREADHYVEALKRDLQ